MGWSNWCQTAVFIAHDLQTAPWLRPHLTQPHFLITHDIELHGHWLNHGHTCTVQLYMMLSMSSCLSYHLLVPLDLHPSCDKSLYVVCQCTEDALFKLPIMSQTLLLMDNQADTHRARQRGSFLEGL